MMTEPEIDALLHVTNSPRYVAGMLSVSHHGDSRDASIMTGLTNTGPQWPQRNELMAFLGMSADEVYEASGRAERDRLELVFRKRLYAVQKQADTRDYVRMHKLTKEDSQTYMAPQDKANGFYTPIAMRWL